MKYLIQLILLLSISFSVNALDLRKVKDLHGTWKFNIGDEASWSAKNYNDSEWDELIVPGAWEEDGYVGYNGYAWYRKDFSLKNYDNHKYFYLVFYGVDDVDEVFFNGKKVGFLGKFPPDFETAWNHRRSYIIPADWLEERNVIAVRVYDKYSEGGIRGEVKIYVDNDESYLDLDLSGTWKFKTSHNKEWKAPEYNDENWAKVFVPQMWEAQGYADYDGYAWYRKEFVLPDHLKREDLMLILGKIDDADMVYFNGKLIGTSLQDSKRNNWKGDRNAWLKNRVYEIPNDLLKKKNVIAIAVYDMGGHGGIFEGPIGIMTERNYKQTRLYHEKNNESFNSIWKYLFQ